MTAHEHHTHPETNEPYCCCGWGYPDPERSGQPVAGLPTWHEVCRRAAGLPPEPTPPAEPDGH